MKICVVNHYAVPPSLPGGSRHYDLALEWDAAGDEVTLFCSAFNHFDQNSQARMPGSTPVGLRSRMVALKTRGYRGNGLGRGVGMLTFAVRIVLEHRIIGKSEVIVGSSPHPFAALGALVVAKGYRRPFVFEIRDLWPRTLVDIGGLGASSLSARALYWVERLLVEAADGVVYLPPKADVYFAERALRVSRSLHVPNSSHRMNESSSEVAVLPEAVVDAQQTGAKVFCYAGTLGKANGLEAVVKAFLGQSAREAVLLIIGDGPERRTLEDLVPRSDNRVVFAGRLGRDAALSMLSKADVAVFHLLDAPVFRYGLSPNKLIDYLRLGKPILYAGPDVINPTSGSGACVAAVPGDVDSIGRAICEFTGMVPRELAHMGENAHARGVDGYDGGVVAGRYREFLDEIRAHDRT